MEVDGMMPDMNQILGQIRQEYDEIEYKNRDEAEQWYKVIIIIHTLCLSQCVSHVFYMICR